MWGKLHLPSMVRQRSQAREDGSTGASVEQLCKEFRNGQQGGPAATAGSEEQPAATVEAVVGELFPERAFRFDEEMVKHSLEELLLVLIAVQDGANGSKLMDDLEDHFETDLSPGILYPTLHDFDDEGLLESLELVRSKEYRIDDTEAARARAKSAARQHLALGYVLESMAEEL